MKIAFVYDAIFPFVKGGAEKHVYDIGTRLSKRGHEVHWFGIKWWGGEDVIDNDGIICHGVCKPRSLYTKREGRSIIDSIWFSLKLIRPLAREKFDIIDCQQVPYFSAFPAKLVSVLKGTPLVITWYEVWGDYWHQRLGRKGFFGRIIERICLKLPKKILPFSPKVEEDLRALGIDKEMMEVIPTGLELEKIQRSRKYKKNYHCIYVGRLVKYKNVDLVIRAIGIVRKKLPDVRCAIVGDGPKRRELENIVEENKLRENMEFLGFKSHDDVISCMKSSKIFVFPSVREGLGIVVLEANACGLPVITVDHPMNASKQLITDGKNGFIVKVSEEQIAEKIIDLITNENLRKKMSLYSIDYVREYDWNILMNKIERIYNDVIT